MCTLPDEAKAETVTNLIRGGIMQTLLTLDKCEELTTHIQEIAKQYHIATDEDLEDVGLTLSECTWKEGEFSLKTDCGSLLNIYENETAETLCKLVDGLLFPYGYATGDPYSDREIHVYKF